MSETQTLKSSEALRAEQAAIAGELEVCNEKISLFDQKAAELALDVYRKDSTAAGRLVQIRDCKIKVRDEIVLLENAKAAIEGEISAAEKREQFERDKLAAANQERIAEQLEACNECDNGLAMFKAGVSRLMALARQAGPDRDGKEQLIHANIVEAFRWNMLEFRQLLDIKLPEALEGNRQRPTFGYLARSWATAARGYAARLLKPPAAKKANGHDAIAAALALNGKSHPQHVDIHHRLPGDPPSFSIRDPSGAKQ